MQRITREPLDVASLLGDTENDTCGAFVVFGGTVRNHHQGRGVAGMRYSAYEPMAERVLEELEEETRRRFGVAECRIVHRIGELGIGETSVLVAVRSAHRGDAFSAGQYAIDTLKERLPVWKEDFYTDGSRGYQDGTPLATAGVAGPDDGGGHGDR
ncbi:molybdenum cofactor biosynthesis protein MoaE [Aquisalimonas lutea]|uniref:molybdenum cofactor biosynthesis protein MoaE n=1 Tax=Aquisalimonas lutea TaxID=1327750 RepID=UPI0025B409AB|nr:molybdenum cofactor biosynthesis protein MoaE [Aquisalimonas lutea]MDN3519672.1 molybdenum cofactor biosynthesis protein MoaE [Aquisalimonas lutea]